MADLSTERLQALSALDWTVEDRGDYSPPEGASKAERLLGAIVHHEAEVLDQGGDGTVAHVVCREDAHAMALLPVLAREVLRLRADLRSEEIRADASLLRAERAELERDEARTMMVEAIERQKRAEAERDEAMAILGAGREYMARDKGVDLEHPPELPTGLVERARHVVEALDAETQGHDEARREIRQHRAALSTPEGYRGVVADAVAEDLERVTGERDEAQDLLRRADLILAHALARLLSCGWIPSGDTDRWIDDSRPHIAAAVERHESPERGEEG